MAIRSIQIEGYRSLLNFRLRLAQITVVTGPNGTGKSNLYRSLNLLHHAAEGSFARGIADEGGMHSAMWSGAKSASKKRREIALTIHSDPLSYKLVAGLPPQAPGDPSMFLRDPDIKEELIWAGEVPRPSATLLNRQGAHATVMDAEAIKGSIPMALNPAESILSQIREPAQYPQLTNFQHRLSNWRFYHQFRSDAGAPMRRPQVGCRTPVLSHDGHDLAAALQTIKESGRDQTLHDILEQAFPDAQLLIEERDGWFTVAMDTSLTRPLEAHELSDGTLRFLCLAAALLSPAPPELLILNEPETSLNPSLIPPLAQLILEASAESQIWVCTHSDLLVEMLEHYAHDLRLARLTMVNGQTRIEGKEDLVFDADEL